MSKKPFFAGVILLVSLALIGASLAYWKYRNLQADANKPPMEPPDFVEVLAAETVSWQPTARLVGTVVARRSVMLANEIVGVATEVGFDSGQTIEKGTVLLKLDDSTEQADLAAALAAERLASTAQETALANIRAAEANLSLARSNLRRNESAAAGNAVSAQDLDRARAELEKATADLDKERSAKTHALAELDQARARTQQIRTVIAKKVLISPFRARAGMRTVHPGQYLAQGTSIVELTELTDEIFLDFAVPQKYAGRVVPGMEVMAQSSVLGSRSVPVRVVSVDATVNPVTRNLRVRTTVPNRGLALKPGMFIDVEIPTEEAKDFVAVPTTAVRRSSAGDHLFVLDPGDPKKDPPGAMRARQRPVTLGPDIGGRAIISAGLKPGERIAAAGSFKLREGALVMAAPPPKGAASPSAPVPSSP